MKIHEKKRFELMFFSHKSFAHDRIQKIYLIIMFFPFCLIFFNVKRYFIY